MIGRQLIGSSELLQTVLNMTQRTLRLQRLMFRAGRLRFPKRNRDIESTVLSFKRISLMRLMQERTIV